MLYIHLIRPSLFQFKYQIPTETNLSHKATKQHLYNKGGVKNGIILIPLCCCSTYDTLFISHKRVRQAMKYALPLYSLTDLRLHK